MKNADEAEGGTGQSRRPGAWILCLRSGCCCTCCTCHILQPGDAATLSSSCTLEIKGHVHPSELISARMWHYELGCKEQDNTLEVSGKALRRPPCAWRLPDCSAPIAIQCCFVRLAGPHKLPLCLSGDGPGAPLAEPNSAVSDKSEGRERAGSTNSRCTRAWTCGCCLPPHLKLD